MDYVEKSDYSGKRHLLADIQWGNPDMLTLKAITECGRTLTDYVKGGCIPQMIDCKRCAKAMQ